ncbi:hypothetical protein [Nitrospirillum iridis]|uniref:Uncharacterized protein n=1 Tax=Nitrospirillum iridis TaxID=765888 RepID=A0A7X0EF66_9PROT|nr:hypothetical protein [Nitrospirillum iridis]MBB6254623.1 hypothetical protein [Nitrospirillum iridis]
MRRLGAIRGRREAVLFNTLNNLLSVTVVLLLLVPLADLAMQLLPPVVGALPPLLVGLVLLAFLGQALAGTIRHIRLPKSYAGPHPGSQPKEIVS